MRGLHEQLIGTVEGPTDEYGKERHEGLFHKFNLELLSGRRRVLAPGACEHRLAGGLLDRRGARSILVR